MRTRIEEMKAAGEIRSQNELAAKAGISKSSLSEALSDDAVQSTVMPQIHKALGWPKPLMAPPVVVLRLVEYFDQLSEFRKGEWLERFKRAAEEERKKRR